MAKSFNKGGLAVAQVSSKQDNLVSMDSRLNEKGSLLLNPQGGVIASWFSIPIATRQKKYEESV